MNDILQKIPGERLRDPWQLEAPMLPSEYGEGAAERFPSDLESPFLVGIPKEIERDFQAEGQAPETGALTEALEQSAEAWEDQEHLPEEVSPAVSESVAEFDPYAAIRPALSPEHAALAANEITAVLGPRPAILALHGLLSQAELPQAVLAVLLGKTGRRSLFINGADIPIAPYLRQLSLLCREAADYHEAELGTAMPRIFPIPRIPAINDPLSTTEFRPEDWPSSVQQLFGKGGAAWLESLDGAIGAGIKETKRLADLIFFMQHPERMKAGRGRLIDLNEEDFVQVRAEWVLYRTIAARRLDPGLKPSVFVPPHSSKTYEEFISPPTSGSIKLMVNGRSRKASGAVDDQFGAFDSMQEAVESLGPKDSLFIANWQFIPDRLPLTIARAGLATWGDLLVKKANEEVRIRVMIGKQPPFSPFDTPLQPLDDLIRKLPGAKRDNFKYISSAHSALFGSHHQKFMIAKSAEKTVAFCGGLDISSNRTPPGWSPTFVWHDIHSRLEGPITRDLEREFAMRWNREKSKNLGTAFDEWKGLEELDVPAAATSGRPAGSAKNKQMVRTVSVGTNPHDIRRDDIWRAYFLLVGRATRLLYLENQYFHEPLLADAIVKQSEAQKDLIVMVVVTTGTDDIRPGVPQAQIEWVQNGQALRFEFFKRLSAIPAARRRFYTLSYAGGLLHSKLALVDDEALTIGSANANPRGFFLDSELNVIIDEPDTVQKFRHRLWAHNLGAPEEGVASWRPSDYFTMWDLIAESNKSQAKSADKMIGEGVVRYNPLDPSDPHFTKGRKGPLHIVPVAPGIAPSHVWF